MDHIETVNLLHSVELIQILSPEEIKNNRISAFEGVYNSLSSIKSNLVQKVETLFQPKVNVFLDKIESRISEIDDFLNYLEDDQNQSFYEKFSSTFEEHLSKYEKNSQEIANEINFVEEFAILNKEDAWKSRIGEKETNSDYKKSKCLKEEAFIRYSFFKPIIDSLYKANRTFWHIIFAAIRHSYR